MIPTKKINHTAILITHEGQNILVDCGEGTQRQFKKAEINPCRLTHLLITHWHGDHILGIPGLLQTLSLNSYSRTLKIYGPYGTKKHMDQIFSMFLHESEIKIEVHEIGELSFESGELRITSFKMDHGVPCLSYNIEQKARTKIDMGKLKKFGLKEGPLVGDLQKGKEVLVNGKKIKPKDVTYQQKGKKISVIMDTRINENCIKAAKDADVLICESTYIKENQDKAKEYKHLTSEQAGEIAKKSKAKSLYLTHLSQRYEMRENQILKEAKKKFSKVFLTEDLMRIEL